MLPICELYVRPLSYNPFNKIDELDGSMLPFWNFHHNKTRLNLTPLLGVSRIQ